MTYQQINWFKSRRT